ncbi:unnamed protein product [Calypogeia fissa]
MAKFGPGDPYLQQPLERREIIEASHKAAIQMAEMLGQDANVHAAGAQDGQHAAIPLPKADQGLAQPIKLFLVNKETPEDLESTGKQFLGKGQDDYGEIQDSYGDDQDGLMDIEYQEEQEELITDILERRLAYLYMAFQPQEPVEGPADTLIIVRRSKTSVERVLIRAHSQVLKRTNDAFNELIGYRPPMVPTTSNFKEEEETGMQISWKTEDAYPPHRTSIYSNLMNDTKKEREDKSAQARSQYQGNQDKFGIYLEDEPQNSLVDSTLNFGNGQGEGNLMFGEEDIIVGIDSNEESLEYGHVDKLQRCTENHPDQKKVSMTQGLQIQEMGAQHLTTEIKKGQRRVSWAQDSQTKRMDLGLENVIGNLQDSIKPSLVNQFLDASLNLVQLPGWDHLPTDLKQSFEQFAASVNKFKLPDLKPLREASAAKTEIDGKSLESEFLGMVGRGSKEMMNILANIGNSIVERRASKVLLEKAKLEDLEGKPGNAVSAKVPRTSLERRKSQTYVENQQRRSSIAPSARLSSVPLVTHQDKRISFLERRQSKALVQLAKIEQKTSEEEEITLRRRSSKAGVAAFERRKHLSTFENKRSEELSFGLHSRESIIMLEKRRDSNARRESTTSRVPGQFGIARKLVQFMPGSGGTPKQTVAKMGNEARKSQSYQVKELPTLSHTRDEDKNEVMRFYEEESKDIYETCSSSSSDLEPPPLPKDVEFVIEKMHWTFDTLCALMEFIYTENLHASCVELPDVYKAANEILLSSLTDAIRLKPIVQYFRLAMVNEENRISLLDLSHQLTTSADFENYVNKNEDFLDLKKLCEAFELEGPPDRRPYTLLLETGHIAFRNIPFVTQGLHAIEGQMVLILKDPREGTRLFEQNLEQNDYLTFQKKLSDQKGGKPFSKMQWLGQWPAIERTRNREKAWKVFFFNFIQLKRDVPLKNYIFYKHLNSLTLRPSGKEEFNVRVVCGILICPVLFKALQLSFPELEIVAGRGAGYYLGGETHGNNITLTGHPLHLLRACKSLPRHLVGRTVLRVAHPSEKTFVRLFMSTNRFGVDLECGVMYFLKPLIQIQKILEYWHDLDTHANYAVTHPREIVELVEPHDPF